MSEDNDLPKPPPIPEPTEDSTTDKNKPRTLEEEVARLKDELKRHNAQANLDRYAWINLGLRVTKLEESRHQLAGRLLEIVTRLLRIEGELKDRD